MRKKLLTILMIMLVICSLTIVGVTFAYYRQYDAGWPQKISATSVVFKLNGKSVNTVTNYDLDLVSRGKEAELDFEVSIKASASKNSVASFTLDISFDERNGHNNELARAIEVHEFIDGEYKYIGMLNEMDSITGNLTVNTEKNFYYKFVYSEAASDYFDDKSFSLILNASSGINSGESDYYFAASYDGLMRAAEAGAALSGKTLILTNDIAVTSSNANNGVVDFSYPISLDLNGKTLSLGAGTALNFTYTTAGKPAVINSNPTVTGKITGEGMVNYVCPTSSGQEDFVFVQDSLSDSYDRITISNASFNAVATEMQSQIDVLSTNVLKVGTDVDFTNNLKYYFSSYYAGGALTLTPPMSGAVDDDSVVLKTDESYTAYVINPVYSEEFTKIHHINFALTSNNQSTSLRSHLTVRGTSISAVATALLAGVPDTINGSVFLAGHDAESNSTVTWVSSNGILTGDGVYLPDGYENLSSWADTTVSLGVIVHCAGISYSAYKNVTVRVLSPKQRTDIIYGYQQIIVDELDSETDIFSSYVNAENATKAGLIDIIVTIDDEAQNKNDIGDDYLQILSGTDNDRTAKIKVLNKPSVGNSVLVDVTLQFIYADKNSAGETVQSTHSVQKTVTVVGFTDSTGLNDPTSSIQQSFDSNAYINGTDYTFTVSGYTTQGANVDYFVNPQYAEYLFVQNGVYTADPTGMFARLNGEYIFFDATYNRDEATGEYISALNGDYILIDSEYVSIADARRNNEIFVRETSVTVLPSRVPAVLETSAILTARIWETMENGEPVYLTDTDNNVLEYTLTLAIRGIYHNVDGEIEEYNIYSTLLRYFDLDGNGWIEVSEAQTEWFDGNACLLSATLDEKTVDVGSQSKKYYYIDFSGLSASSLKGLEYFTGALGFNFSGNQIINISQLNALYQLNYIDLSNNLVSDITYLGYLDSLGYIDLRGNPLTSIQPIRYLPAVGYLDLNSCDNITSYEFIQDYTGLHYLDIRRTNYPAISDETAYYMSLIYDNNRNNSIIMHCSAENQWAPTNEQIVAARVLREMVCVGEVYTTLNLPNYYYYEYSVDGTLFRKEYNVSWMTAINEHNLIFTTVNGQTTGYVITTPIVNKNVTVFVTVTDVADTSSAVRVGRTFNLTLLQSQAQEDIAYIQTADGVSVATDIVPDVNLLNVLFDIFNITSTGTVTIGDNTYNERSILTQDELTAFTTTNHDDSFSGAGITSLTGLRHFAAAMGFDLDLRDNVLDGQSIGELSYMTNVKVIKLNGADYDYSLISSYTDGTPSPTITGLTGLTALYVYGCLELDSDVALNRLYQVYLANPEVSIYKDGESASGIWNPYEILPKYAQSLPSAFVFINLNDTVSYYESGQSTQTYNFYGVKNIDFTLTMNDANLSGFFRSNFTHTSTGIKYRTLAGYSDTVYDKTALTGNDGSGRENITTDHFIELKIDFNYRILVTDYPLQSGNVGLDIIFPGRDLRAAVISKLSTLFASGNGVGYTVDGNYYYITMATIAALNFGNDQLTVDGTFSEAGDNVIQGLQYTSIKKVKIARDANFGDGTYLTGLTQLVVAYSGVDFSTITIDLPNMENLWIGSTTGTVGGRVESNRYTVLYDNSGSTPVYNLAHFTGLKQFVLLGSNCYNWQGLNGLIGLNLRKLYIYATSDTYTNKNANASATEAIVRQIYNASNATNKDFRIGTSASATATDQYTGGDEQSTVGGVTEITQDPVKEYKDFAHLIHDLGVRLDGSLTTILPDMLIGNSGVITLPSSTFASYGTSNGDINEFTRRFAIQWRIYGMTAAEAQALFGLTGLTGGATDSGIDYVIIPNTANGLTDITLTTNSMVYDFYFVIVGTIGEEYITADGVSHANGGYFDETGVFIPFAGTVTPYTYGYPILVEGSAINTNIPVNIAFANLQNGAVTGTFAVSGNNFYQTTENSIALTYLSYKAISDPGLRFRLFASIASLSSVSGDRTYGKNGMMFYSSSDNYLGVANINVISGDITTNTISLGDGTTSNVTLSTFGRNLSNIYIDSLGGLEYFIGLTRIDLQNNDIRDISALSSLSNSQGKHLIYNGSSTTLAGLTLVNLRNNIVCDISAFAALSTLENVNLSGNPVTGLTYMNGEVEEYIFATSIPVMTTLNLNSCKLIASEDITAMAVAYSTGSGSPLSMLSVFDTDAVYKADTLRALSRIANSVSGALNVSYTAATTAIFTTSDIEGLFEDITPAAGTNSNTLSSYVNTGYALYFDFINSLTIDGTTYALSLLTGNMILTDSKTRYIGTLGSTTATLRIRTGAQYAVDYEIKIYDTTGGTATDSTSAPIAIYNNTSSFHYSTEFDPALWQYLVSNSTRKSTTDNTVYFDYSPGADSLILPSGIGMKSLKGINLLTNLVTLEVGSTDIYNYSLTSLWEGEFLSLRNFNLINSGVAESAMYALRFAPNLTTLRLAHTEGIDYLKSFTYTFDGISFTSTVAEIILDYCPSITSLYINMIKTERAYGGATALGEYLSSLNGNSYIFGIQPSENTNARRLSSFTRLSNFSSALISEGAVNTHSLRSFDYSEAATTQAIFINGQSNIRTGNNSIDTINLDVTTGVERASLVSTANERDILPTNIYQSDIETTGVLFYLPETLRVNGTTLNYTWTITSGISSYLQNNVFYVNQSNFDSSNLTVELHYALRNGNRNVKTGSHILTIVPSDISTVSSTSKLPPYYVEVPGESGYTVLRPAADYFKSTRLLFWLFDIKFDNSLPQITLNNYQDLGVPVSAIGSYYISQDMFLNTTELEIPYEGINSLAGLELFVNLTHFKIDQGSITSIEELANMSLISFEYANATDGTGRNFLLQDFTPLLNSKDSLTTFKYHTHGYHVNIDDLVFLKEFGEQLTSITIGNSTTGTIEGYNHTLSFKYIANWYAANRPNTTLTYNGVNETAAATDGDWQRATEMFENVDFTNTGLTEKSDSRVVFSSLAQFTSATVTASLPTFINRGGSFYPLTWNTLSSFVSLSALTYRGADFSYTFEGNNTPTSIIDGSVLTQAQYAELLESREFLQILISDTGSISQSLTLSDRANNLSAFSYLLARITIDGFEYERSYILDFGENLEYNQILLKSGVGFIYLPTMYGNSSVEWYLKGADGNPIEFDNVGIATYSGVTLRNVVYNSSSRADVVRPLLVVTNPTEAISGKISLLRKQGVVYTEYVLYHEFTADNKSSAQTATSPTVVQRDYVIAINTVDFNTIINNYTTSLNSLYADCTLLFNAGNYSSDAYARITAAYNTAIGAINSETNLNTALSHFNTAVSIINSVPRQFDVYYNMLADGSGASFAETITVEEGQTVTLPEIDDYTFAEAGEVTSWLVDGVYYVFGSTLTMPSHDVVITPAFVNIGYYLTKSGEENSYLSTGYVMKECDTTIDGVTYEFFVDNIVIDDAWLEANKGFSVVNRATGTAVGKHTITSERTEVLVRAGSSKSIHSGIGIYTFYFDIDNSTPDSALTAERGNYFFTLSGSYGSGLPGSETIQWQKPDMNYVLQYSRELSLFYITLSYEPDDSISNGIKVCGYMPANMTNSSSAIGKEYYLSDGNGTTNNILNFKTDGINEYTVYFTPQASVFNNSAIANYGGSAIGFTNETGTVSDENGNVITTITYASNGIVIAAGDYEHSKDAIKVNFETAQG